MERKNRTIINMMQSMLKIKNLPKEFWAETTACTVYILNHCPTTNLKMETPQEAWAGPKPNISHMKIFKCIAYVHVPEQRMSKLDDKSIKAIFIEYSSKSKLYKLYDPNNFKIIISRDVEFDEEGIWSWHKVGEIEEAQAKIEV